MSEYIVLYNPEAQRGRGLQNAQKLEQQVTGACTYQDMTEEGFSFPEFVKNVDPAVKIVITGGDGTLNHLLNSLPTLDLPRGLYFFPGGTGNDFVRDLKFPEDCGPILLNPYLEDLPVVEAGGKRFWFLNGVGVGMDGYCCAEKERLKQRGLDRSYARIAIEAIFGKYSTCDAEITVDGVTEKYKRVWMAPAMFGRYFGGGIEAAPKQKRGAKEHTLTSVVVHDSGRLRALFMFLLFCKGEGKDFPNHIRYRVGHDIQVKITKATAIQIDGETIEGLTEYHAYSRRPDQG